MASRFSKSRAITPKWASHFPQEVEDWFDLTQPTFQPVFSFTRQGSYEPFSEAVGREVRAQATSTRVDGIDAIDVTLTVTFDGPDIGVHAEFEGIYKRSSSARIFSLREAYSGMDRRAVIPLRDFAGPGGVDFNEISNERLVFYAFPGQKKIASGPNKVAMEWLQLVLGHVDDDSGKVNAHNISLRSSHSRLSQITRRPSRVKSSS